MRANAEDSNWDQLLAFMQELCETNNEIASNTSNLDRNATTIVDTINNAPSGNVNITNNNVGNINNKSDNSASLSDIPSYVKNIFMGNDASNSMQKTNSILRNKIGIMARGD